MHWTGAAAAQLSLKSKPDLPDDSGVDMQGGLGKAISKNALTARCPNRIKRKGQFLEGEVELRNKGLSR